MLCPGCNQPINRDTARVLSRHGGPEGPIRRRRECLGCQHRFSTLEMVVPAGRGRADGLPAELAGLETDLANAGRRLAMIRAAVAAPDIGEPAAEQATGGVPG